MREVAATTEASRAVRLLTPMISTLHILLVVLRRIYILSLASAFSRIIRGHVARA